MTRKLVFLVLTFVWQGGVPAAHADKSFGHKENLVYDAIVESELRIFGATARPLLLEQVKSARANINKQTDQNQRVNMEEFYQRNLRFSCDKLVADFTTRLHRRVRHAMAVFGDQPTGSYDDFRPYPISEITGCNRVGRHFTTEDSDFLGNIHVELWLHSRHHTPGKSEPFRITVEARLGILSGKYEKGPWIIDYSKVVWFSSYKAYRDSLLVKPEALAEDVGVKAVDVPVLTDYQSRFETQCVR